MPAAESASTGKPKKPRTSNRAEQQAKLADYDNAMRSLTLTESILRNNAKIPRNAENALALFSSALNHGPSAMGDVVNKICQLVEPGAPDGVTEAGQEG